MDTIRIGNATVNFSRLTIEGEAGLFSVEPKVLEVLRVLIDKPGEVRSRDELIDAVWGVSYGGDERLSRAISLLRKALGDDLNSKDYIETIPKRGYRLTATIALAGSSNGSSGDETGNDRATAQLGNRQRFRWAATIAVLPIVVAGLIAITRFTGQESDANMERAAVGRGQAYRNSIAILPFTDLTARKNQEYLADGITEEILNAIAKVQDLHVVGQASSFRYRDANPDPGKVGADLNVRYLLTGSLQMQDRNIRVVARLVEVDSRRVIWSESYAGATDRIFQFQDSIARAIAKELSVAIASKDRLAPKMTANAEAYALFVQGRDLARRFGTENKRTSIRLLEQATQADPDFALAWAWLGASKLLLAIPETPRNARALVREARVAVSRALLIDPNLSMGHYVQATLHDHDLDFAGSMASIERAYAADPNQPFILIRRGEYYALIGQIDKAQAMIEEGLARDPTDAAGLVKLAQIRMIKGDFESARQLSQRSLELGFEPAGGFVCTSLYALDKVREAVDCWVRLPAVMKARYEPVFSGDAMWAGIGRAVFAGDEQARRSVLESLRLHFARPDPKVNTYLMQLHMGLRAPELFMKRFVDFPYNGNASVMPALWMGGDAALVRTNPAFPAFAERVGLIRAWERYGWPDKCRKTGPTADGSITFACT